MKKTFTLATAVLATLGLNAQVIIDQADFPVAGDSFFMGSDAEVPVGTNVGTASGTAQTWDFSNLETDTLYSLSFVTPSSVVPFGALFPTAEIAFNQGGGYAFADLAGGDVTIIGISVDFGGGGGPIPLSMGVTADDPWKIFQFPATYNTSFNDVAMFDTAIYSVGLVPSPYNLIFNPDSIRFKRNITSSATIDAFGTLTDVMGNTHQVLRMNTHEVSIDTAWGLINGTWTIVPNIPGVIANPNVSDKRLMRFLSKSMGYIVTEIEVDQTTGAPISALFLSDPSECCTGVEEMVMAGKALVYPNPATEFISVRTGGDQLVLTVADLSGRTVLTTAVNVDGERIDISDLRAGTYIYRLAKTDGTPAANGHLIRN